MSLLRPFRFPLLALATLLLAGCVAAPLKPIAELRSILAPTGKLRVGVYPGSPSSMIKDPVTGEVKGLAYDLGKELAKRLGVPFQPVIYPRVSDVLDGVKSGAVDLTITYANPARTKDMDFSPTLFDLELGYLVPRGSRVAAADAIDRAGIRVGVSQGGTSHGMLSRELKQATVVPAPSVTAAIDMLHTGAVDVFATNKGVLYQMADLLPGSRVLEGNWGVEHFAFAIPKGRADGLAYVTAFAEDIADKRYLAMTVERAGLRGAR
jgi:polar amino acid transport system substrate-binding protein